MGSGGPKFYLVFSEVLSNVGRMGPGQMTFRMEKIAISLIHAQVEQQLIRPQMLPTVPSSLFLPYDTFLGCPGQL